MNNVTVRAGVTYAHLFSGATTPTNGDLGRERRNASGENIVDDQLSFRRLETDRLTWTLGFDLPLYKNLLLSTSYRLVGGWVSGFSDHCVDIGTNCADVGEPQEPTYRVSTSFDLGLSYPIYDVVSLTLGYNNDTLQLGNDAKRRNFLYSPDAQFYLDIIANLDSIYSKVTGRKDKNEGVVNTRALTSNAIDARGGARCALPRFERNVLSPFARRGPVL